MLVLTLSTSFIAANLCIQCARLFSQPLTSELGVRPLPSRSTLVGVGKAGPSHCLVSISIAYSETKPRSQDGLRTAYGHLELGSHLPTSPAVVTITLPELSCTRFQSRCLGYSVTRSYKDKCREAAPPSGSTQERSIHA